MGEQQELPKKIQIAIMFAQANADVMTDTSFMPMDVGVLVQTYKDLLTGVSNLGDGRPLSPAEATAALMEFYKSPTFCRLAQSSHKLEQSSRAPEEQSPAKLKFMTARP